MPNFKTLEPAIDPNNRISFLLDWELTMKCNLSCSYCLDDLHGGRNNIQPHPPVQECLKSLDFMFAYADEYMQYKPNGIKTVILNVYGGESLYHPDIVEILTQARQRYEKYKDRWSLTITTTTNLILSQKTLDKIIPLIDEFTVSQHSEVTTKQAQQFKDNILRIKSAGRRLKAVVLMHHNPELFKVSEQFIEWANANDINILPRQLDVYHEKIYDEKQVAWFDSEYSKKTYGQADKIEGSQNLSATGRACCGGRQICLDQNYSERKFYVVGNSFNNWYCSVNWFFLFVKQVNGEVYFNKDCKMNFDKQVAPIGTLSDTESILTTLRDQLTSGNMPIVQCKKKTCLCGLCAPKAENLNDYKKIMLKYQRKITT